MSNDIGFLFLGLFGMIALGILVDITGDSRDTKRNKEIGEFFHRICECSGGEPYLRKARLISGHPQWVYERYWCELDGIRFNMASDTSGNHDGRINNKLPLDTRMYRSDRTLYHVEKRLISETCEESWVPHKTKR